MPLYLFMNPETGEEKEVLQKMTEPHVYIDENGLEWVREFTSHQVCGGLNHDPFKSDHFVEKSRHSNSATLGELVDRAKEDSYSRADKNGGVDPIKSEWFKSYSAKRKGKKHPKDPSK